MREEGIQPNLVIYNTAISAIAKSSRLNMQRVTKYQSKMKSGAHATSSTSDDQRMSVRALSLLEKMKSDNIDPDAWTYSGVISTLGSCGEVQDALTLFEEMRAAKKANKISYTAAIGAFISVVLPTGGLFKKQM